jgi:hypothetical protein
VEEVSAHAAPIAVTEAVSLPPGAASSLVESHDAGHVVDRPLVLLARRPDRRDGLLCFRVTKTKARRPATLKSFDSVQKSPLRAPALHALRAGAAKTLIWHGNCCGDVGVGLEGCDMGHVGGWFMLLAAIGVIGFALTAAWTVVGG